MTAIDYKYPYQDINSKSSVEEQSKALDRLNQEREDSLLAQKLQAKYKENAEIKLQAIKQSKEYINDTYKGKSNTRELDEQVYRFYNHKKDEEATYRYFNSPESILNQGEKNAYNTTYLNSYYSDYGFDIDQQRKELDYWNQNATIDKKTFNQYDNNDLDETEYTETIDNKVNEGYDGSEYYEENEIGGSLFKPFDKIFDYIRANYQEDEAQEELKGLKKDYDEIVRFYDNGDYNKNDVLEILIQWAQYYDVYTDEMSAELSDYEGDELDLSSYDDAYTDEMSAELSDYEGDESDLSSYYYSDDLS